MPDPLLEIRNLTVEFSTRGMPVRGVDGLSLRLDAGDRLALVGESGCGKTSLARAIMGLLPSPGASVSGESVRLAGRELLDMPEHEYRRLRGRSVAMIPQSPTNALNPVQPIGRQMATIIRRQLGVSRRQARQQAAAALERLDLAGADWLLRRYPHQLSGGTRQRVLIALALVCRPRLLISDEGTSALDPTTRDNALDQLGGLCRDQNTALVLITHDFALIAGHCRRVAVMYRGQIVEQAPIDELFRHPRHPYTAALLAAVPRMTSAPDTPLAAVPDVSTAPAQAIQGCRFAPRCPQVQSLCLKHNPDLSGNRDQAVRCHFPLGPPN